MPQNPVVGGKIGGPLNDIRFSGHFDRYSATGVTFTIGEIGANP